MTCYNCQDHFEVFLELMRQVMFIVTHAIKVALGMPVPTISDMVSSVALGIIWGIFAGLG